MTGTHYGMFPSATDPRLAPPSMQAKGGGPVSTPPAPPATAPAGANPVLDALTTPVDAYVRAGQVMGWIAQLHHVERQRAARWARYGPGGTFEHERKTLLCAARDQERLRSAVTGEKTTEARLDDVAHMDAGYQEFLDRAYAERTELALLDAEVTRLEGLIALAKSLTFYDGNAARVAGAVGGMGG